MGKIARIEAPRSRARVWCLGLSFFFAFLFFIIIGATAPPVLRAIETIGNDIRYNDDSETNYYTFKLDAMRAHQIFWVEMRISTMEAMQEYYEDDGTVDVELEINLTVDLVTDRNSNVLDEEPLVRKIQCDIREDWCTYFPLWKTNFVDPGEYVFFVTIKDPKIISQVEHVNSESIFQVETLLVYINPSFTRFQVWWKYTFVFFTLLFMLWPGDRGGACCEAWSWLCPWLVWKGFLPAARKARQNHSGWGWRSLNFHQKWTMALLVGLLLFNDPLVFGTVHTGAATFFSAFFIVCAAAFMFELLLFWLCLFSHLRFMEGGGEGERTPRASINYWVPKVVLCLAISITALDSYIFYRFDKGVTPEYTGIDDNKEESEKTAGFLGTFMFIYMAWIFYLIIRSWGVRRGMSPSYRLLYLASLVTCAMAIVGVFAAGFYPYSTSTSMFLALYGLTNLYIWGLSISFTPVEGENIDPRAQAQARDVGIEEAEMAGAYPSTLPPAEEGEGGVKDLHTGDGNGG
ncbi:unnamed protein product, partial [Discosporangium mesarthrocarpum]